MNNLKKCSTPLRDLVKGLTNEEINSVRRYLNCFDEIFGNNKTKTANLFDLLISDEEMTQDEIISILYTNSSSVDAFEKLSIRLIEKIHECLILDINVERKDVYPEFVKATIDVRKKIMQAHILLGRGLSNELENVYDKIIVKAKKYELYSELVEVSYLKQIYLGLRKGKVEYEKLTAEIKFYEYCRDAVHKATDYYYRLIINNEFSSINVVDKKLLSESVDDLKEIYNYTKSANIGYYLHLLEFELFQINGQQIEAKSVCHNLVDLIQDNPSIYMKRRLGSAFYNLAENELYSYDFKSAGLHARLAQDYFNKNTSNHSAARELEFYSFYYQGDLEKADLAINSLISETVVHSEFHDSRRAFLAANVAFLKKNKRVAKNLLDECKEIDKDKEGYNIGIRILSIMNQIDGEVMDIAQNQIESMRKHIERTMKMKEVRGRDITILRILNELVNQSFDFEAVWKSRKHLFDLLASEDEDQKWDIKGHELVIFQEWFKARANQSEYPVAIQKPIITATKEEPAVTLKKVAGK